MDDVIVIGAGVVGCMTARELSRWNLKVAVLEAGSDVAEGASKANSAIVHAGFDAKPGTNKAKFNVLGNKMFENACKELKVPFKRNGSLVLAFNDEEIKGLKDLAEKTELSGKPSEKKVGESISEEDPAKHGIHSASGARRTIGGRNRGTSANQLVLPRHRGTVKRFFDIERKTP